MYQYGKVDKRLLGEQIEDELMKYILEEPVEIGQKIPNDICVGNIIVPFKWLVCCRREVE